MSQNKRERIVHPLAPIYDEDSRVLLLGSMPSPLSRAVSMYYGNPSNRFWRVLSSLFCEQLPVTNEERITLALAHHIAIWDVLASCTIVGAADSTIKDPVPNDLSLILGKAPIRAIFVTGSKAAKLYRRFQLPATCVPATRLPSTSPANAAWSLDRLIEAWQPVREATEA